MNPVLKKAVIQDIDALNKISFSSKMYWNYPKEWMEKWSDDLRLTPKNFEVQHIYKLENDTSIIGFCSMQEREEVYEIMHLWIKPAFIGKGYGKYLLNETIRAVVKKEKPIIVEADPNAEPFYSRQGFSTFKQIESYPKGRFLPVMRRMVQKAW